ncbi:MAG TPA: helix-turn-helix transcriptional regulator [Chloroflexota bacterium]|nr:helix-turn-helix transcriptional regulator [Chloroflexota bacterium]
MESVGKRIRQMRLSRRPSMTLAELAGDDLSVALISKIERDLVNPSLSTLRYLADRLGVSLGQLFEEETVRSSRARAALDLARARLLLGDPAGAASEATLAAKMADGVLRARLLALTAEASFVAGQTAGLIEMLTEAQDLLNSDSSCSHLARAEVNWVLGSVERRRGARANAQRFWTGALEHLGSHAHLDPAHLYLQASIMADLGTLHEVSGAYETARNFVARASTLASSLTQATGPAQALLTRASLFGLAARDDHKAPGVDPLSRQEDLVFPTPTIALSLAAIAAADRLARRLAQEIARLERSSAAPAARVALPDVPHSRHLR